MKRLHQICCVSAFTAMTCGDANAIFFFFFPGGAISRALEKDPESISVSGDDRVLAKCAGFHVNQLQGQLQRSAAARSPFPGEGSAPPDRTSEAEFHDSMGALATKKASDPATVRDLAYAYSARWTRVSQADRLAGRTYASDLATACSRVDIPRIKAEHAVWQARQEEAQRRAAEEIARKQQEAREAEQARQEEARQKAAEEDRLKRDNPLAQQRQDQGSNGPQVTPVMRVDYALEAAKASRILGCTPSRLMVLGADAGNVLYEATCAAGGMLQLTCDPTGLCLRK